MSKRPRKIYDPHDPKSWAPKRSPRGGNPAFGGVELEPSTQWLRQRWEEEVEAGKTTLGWTAWARELGIIVVSNHGWDDLRPGRSTLVPLSSVERPLEDSTSPGATREVEMHPIVQVEAGRRRPRRRRRHRRSIPKGVA